MKSATLTALLILPYIYLISARVKGRQRCSKFSLADNACGDQNVIDKSKTMKHCYFQVPHSNIENNDNKNMPIPFKTVGERNSIIYPDKNGLLEFHSGQQFKLTCASAKFQLNVLKKYNVVLVSCVEENIFQYNGNKYNFRKFWCNGTPLSELKVMNKICHNTKNTTVIEVGFQTNEAFLKIYSTCFNNFTKNSLYAWYEARSPYFDDSQLTDCKSTFIKTKQLYKSIDINSKYTVKQQKKTVTDIFKLKNSENNKYIANDQKHFLAKGHFAARREFYYGFEQLATFYYVNVSPQWQIFNTSGWKKVENIIRKKMVESKSERQVIVTGTYGSCMLSDKLGVKKPLFLNPPNELPVPLFYWKLHYEDNIKNGIVYIGLNNPYEKISNKTYLCNNICEKDFPPIRNDGNDNNNGLIYCCTKESFENIYGIIDSTVFEDQSSGIKNKENSGVENKKTISRQKSMKTSRDKNKKTTKPRKWWFRK